MDGGGNYRGCKCTVSEESGILNFEMADVHVSVKASLPLVKGSEDLSELISDSGVQAPLQFNELENKKTECAPNGGKSAVYGPSKHCLLVSHTHLHIKLCDENAECYSGYCRGGRPKATCANGK